VVALTYRATVDVPARFRKSKAVGAVFGLTCSKYQSGEIDWSGRISRCGDEMMRVMLYEAAQSMLRSKKWSWLKAWAMQIARRRGMKKAIVALARRLAVVLHRIWVDGTEFRWTREQAAAPQNNQLMSERGIFGLKPDLRLERRGQGGQNETQKPDHSASLGDSVTSSKHG
jgi:transposase